MDITECPLCWTRYESPAKVPKLTNCGHVFCLECLNQLMIPRACPTCRKPVTDLPEDMVTIFTMLSEASGEPKSRFYCTKCGKEPDQACKLAGHAFKDLTALREKQMEVSRQMVRTFAATLDKVLQRVLNVDDILSMTFKEQKVQTMDEQSLVNEVSQKLSSTSGSSADADEALRTAGEYSLKLSALERRAGLLELEKGALCRLDLQAGQGAALEGNWTASLDLGAVADTNPEVLAVVRFLFYLLEKSGTLKQKTSKPPGRGPAGDNGRRQDGQGDHHNAPRQNENMAEINKMMQRGELDLSRFGIGEAKESAMVAEKAALLRSNLKVTKISGLKCSEDHKFCWKIINKHSQTLQDLSLKMVTNDHLEQLKTLPELRTLQLDWCDKGIRELSLQAGCVLQSLDMNLPFKVQKNLWEAFASSLSSVKLLLRMEGSVDAHKALGSWAKRSPNLRELCLHRPGNESGHTSEACTRQLQQIRGELATGVLVWCDLCRSSGGGGSPPSSRSPTPRSRSPLAFLRNGPLSWRSPTPRSISPPPLAFLRGSGKGGLFDPVKKK